MQLEVVELQRHLLAADLLPGQSQSQSLRRTAPRLVLGVQDHGCRGQQEAQGKKQEVAEGGTGSE